MTLTAWRERWRASPRLQDVTTAAVIFALGLGLNLLGLTGVWPFNETFNAGPVWWHTLALAAGCLALLGKRRRPIVALLVGSVAIAADVAIGGSVGIVLVLFDLLFAVG